MKPAIKQINSIWSQSANEFNESKKLDSINEFSWIDWIEFNLVWLASFLIIITVYT